MCGTIGLRKISAIDIVNFFLCMKRSIMIKDSSFIEPLPDIQQTYEYMI